MHLEYFNRATKYASKSNNLKALQFYKKELGINEFKECYLNLGNMYRLLDNDKEAYRCYLKAADNNMPFSDNTFGPYALALGNLGLLEYTFGNDVGAIDFYLMALDIDPLHYDTIWNYSSALLRQWCSREEVDLVSAWKMYDFRFKRKNARTIIDNTLPVWDGISSGRSIVVLAEQGYGDKFMWGRYIKCLREYFDEVWVQTPEVLVEVFNDFKTCFTVAESNASVSIPFASLAAKFDMVEGDWLRGKFGVQEFSTDPYKLNIGIEWSGSSSHTNDRNRSCPVGYFTELAKYGTLYSLKADAVKVKGIEHLGCKSWAATAEAVNGLDVVISVDTSVVHLCGSVGANCLVLMPLKETDFRWGNNSMGEDNIWYKSVKVVRNPNSWEKVFEEVKARLEIMKLEKLHQSVLSVSN